MTLALTEKLNVLREWLENEGVMIDADWCGQLLYPYYEHFHDPNPSHRSGSILAFWGLLIDWEEQAGWGQMH